MEQTSTGYDFEVIGDMGKDLECAICMLLLREPVELPCAHVLCKVCLEHWQDNAMEKDAAFLCPSCKKMYQREQVVDSKFLDRYVKTSLQVKCKVNKSGCQWEGKIIDYTQHEEKCIYKSIHCNFVGCKARMIVMDKAKHQIECIYRSVQCKYCLLEVQLINIENHYGSCVKFPLNCPNDGCWVITTRKEVHNHTQNECPYQIVNCKYKTVGCKHQLQRRYTLEHQTQCLPDHMNMLLNGFNMTSQELSSVKEKLRQTEERLHETEKRLHITEEKLAITEGNHQERKIILNQTREELQNTNQDLFQANERITKVINHDMQIDKFCFQLARHSIQNFDVKPFDVKVGLESLATMDYYGIPGFNTTLNSPDVLSHLRKLLEKALEKKEKGLKVAYADRFIQVMDMMETNKLYRFGEKEVFAKFDVSKLTMIYLDFQNYDSFKMRQKYTREVYFSDNVVLRGSCGQSLVIICGVRGWNNCNAKIYLLDPTNSNPELFTNCAWNNINKDMISRNTVIVKGILQ